MNKTIIRSTRPQTITRTRVNTSSCPKAPRALNSDIVTTSYFVGKGITLFTFFYSSLNWMMYKSINKDDDGVGEDTNNKQNKQENNNSRK